MCLLQSHAGLGNNLQVSILVIPLFPSVEVEARAVLSWTSMIYYLEIPKLNSEHIWKKCFRSEFIDWDQKHFFWLLKVLLFRYAVARLTFPWLFSSKETVEHKKRRHLDAIRLATFACVNSFVVLWPGHVGLSSSSSRDGVPSVSMSAFLIAIRSLYHVWWSLVIQFLHNVILYIM